MRLRHSAKQSWLLPLPLANFDITFKILHCSLGMSNEIRHLFVTLKRSFAGTRETHINTVRSLGLRKRQQTVQKANVASVRGAIDKVKHLVTVETDQARAARLTLEAAKAAPRPPITVNHQV